MTANLHITTTFEATDPTRSISLAIPELFALYNIALAEAIEAERDLAHFSGADPAVDHWLTEAEAAWSAAEAIQRALAEAPLCQASDKSLIAMAVRAVVLMETDTLQDFCTVFDGVRLAGFIRGTGASGSLPGDVVRMLGDCQKNLSAIAALELYQPVCDPDDFPYATIEGCFVAC